MSEKKTKLFEVLAAEKGVEAKFHNMKNSVQSTFDKKQTYFEGQIRTYSPKDDEGEQLANENIKLRASVPEELDFFNRFFVDLVDLKVTKEKTNTKAVANLEFNGSVIAENVPATALLAIEKSLIHLKDLLKTTQTRENGEDWSFDDEKKLWKGTTKESQRTEKRKTHKVVAAATDKHPAEIREYIDTVVLGTWSTTRTSGAISTVEKSALLNNVDRMIMEVNKARNRANDVEIENMKIGKNIVDAIFGDIIQKSAEVETKEINRTFK